MAAETLTAEERAFVEDCNADGLECKMLAVIDDLTAENEWLRARLDSEFTHDQLLHEVSSYRSGMIAAESEVARLTAENERLRAQCRELGDALADEERENSIALDAHAQRCATALSAIDALTAENELLRQEHGLLEDRRAVAVARRDQERAENERLRAEETRMARQSADNFTALRAAESRLATAEGLLREIADRVGIPWGFGNLGSRFQAFLASAEPAATQCDHANGCTTECAREQEGAIAQCPNRRPSDGGHSLDYRDGGWCDWCGTRSPQMLERIARKQSERLKKAGES